MSSNSKELILFNDEDPGLPSKSNVLWIESHGARSGNNILIVPENVYIISPCKDDLSWGSPTYYENQNSHIKAINYADIENIESYTGMWGNQHDLHSRISQKLNSMFVKLHLQNTPDNLNVLLTQKIFSELHKLKRNNNINNLFRKGCDKRTDKYREPASDACLRYCVNGPGSHIKNMRFSGTHTPYERYYGARMFFFENKSGITTDMVLNGTKKYSEEWKKIDPKGYEQVIKSAENISERFREKIIDGQVTLEEILFFYKNLGPVSFQKFNEHSDNSDFTTTFEKRCNEPLVIFTGNACRADRYMELGFTNTKYTFLRNSQYSNSDKIKDLIEMFINNDTHYIREIKNIYLTPPRNTSYIGSFTNYRNRRVAIKDSKTTKTIQGRVHNALKTSTFVEESLPSKYENPKIFNNPCSTSRPRLIEYLDDIRSIKNRKYRNITSNKIGLEENKMCEMLASIGLSVGSKIAIVIPKYGETEKISNIILNKFIPSSYTIEEVIRSSDIKNLYDLIKNRDIKDLWSIILLTDIRGIEKNMLSIGTPMLYFGFLNNYYFNDYREKHIYLEKNEKKSIDNFYQKFNIKYSYDNDSNTFYGNSGKISTSMTNMPFSILTHTFWKPDQDLIKIMKKGEKTISRINLYKKLLKINKSSKHYGKGGKKTKKKPTLKKQKQRSKKKRNIMEIYKNFQKEKKD